MLAPTQMQSHTHRLFTLSSLSLSVSASLSASQHAWASTDDVAMNGSGTFCGVFRRQALDRGAARVHADCIVTGHNADDIAETVLMNCACRDYDSLIDRCIDRWSVCVCMPIVSLLGAMLPRPSS
jgi:hypothetical protein